MNLKEARAIARRVGATIEQHATGSLNGIPTTDTSDFVVRLGVCRIGASGTREEVKLHYPSAEEAAKASLLETMKACKELIGVAKQVYVESDLI